MLCCLLPIAILLGAIMLGVKNTYVNALAFLACPLMMIIMMIHQKRGEQCH